MKTKNYHKVHLLLVSMLFSNNLISNNESDKQLLSGSSIIGSQNNLATNLNAATQQGNEFYAVQSSTLTAIHDTILGTDSSDTLTINAQSIFNGLQSGTPATPSSFFALDASNKLIIVSPGAATTDLTSYTGPANINTTGTDETSIGNPLSGDVNISTAGDVNIDGNIKFLGLQSGSPANPNSYLALDSNGDLVLTAGGATDLTLYDGGANINTTSNNPTTIGRSGSNSSSVFLLSGSSGSININAAPSGFSSITTIGNTSHSSNTVNILGRPVNINTSGAGNTLIGNTGAHGGSVFVRCGSSGGSINIGSSFVPANIIIETERSNILIRSYPDSLGSGVIRLSNFSNGSDNGGLISIAAGSNSGNGGLITIETGTSTGSSGGIILSAASSSTGSGGDISLLTNSASGTAGDIELDAGTGSGTAGNILLSTISSSSVQSGRIALDARSNGTGKAGAIKLDSFAFSSGDGGDIILNASSQTGTAGTITLDVGSNGGTTGSIHLLGLDSAPLLTDFVVIDSFGKLSHTGPGTTSSIRYKDNIVPLDNSKTSVIYDLVPVEYEYKKAPGKKEFGLIAEEVEKVLKEAVVYNKEGMPDRLEYRIIFMALLSEFIKLKHEHDDLISVNAESRDRIDILEKMVMLLQDQLSIKSL